VRRSNTDTLDLHALPAAEHALKSKEGGTEGRGLKWCSCPCFRERGREGGREGGRTYLLNLSHVQQPFLDLASDTFQFDESKEGKEGGRERGRDGGRVRTC